MSEKKPRGRPRGSGRRNQSTTFDSIVQLEATTESSQATAASTTQAQPDNISADQYSRPVTRNATAAAQLPTTVPASQSVSTRSGQSATSQSPGAATSKYLPGGGGRKQLTRKPVNPGRRSKEARYALAQEAFEREKEKRQEQANEALRAERARERLLRGRGRGDRARGRGRGGFMGDSHSVSGPFSGGKVTHDHRTKGSKPDSSSHGASKSGPSHKRDPTIKTESSQLGLTPNNEGKREVQDGGYISSDPDEEVEGPVWNVDSPIQIGSDDDDDTGKADSSLVNYTAPRSMTGLIPVRVARKEHKDRVIGINTEASSASAAEWRRRQAESKGTASIDEAMLSAARKGKAKAKDVEVVGSTWFKGMWQDDDDPNDKTIKDEPVDDDAVGGFDGDGEAENPAAPKRAENKLSQPDQSRKRSHKGKARRQLSAVLEPPSTLQTEEEKEEWHRHQLALATLRDELGSIDINGDQDQDVMTGNTEDQPRDQKADRVYLFQFPPVVPDLNPMISKIKSEKATSNVRPEDNPPVNADVDSSTHQKTAPQITTPAAKSSVKNPIRIEDDVKPSTGLEDSKHMPRLASGRVGKLRVHASGRATLSWGGTSLELHMGIPANFLQDVVVLQMPRSKQSFTDAADGDDEKSEDVGEAAESSEGIALGLGQVRGKFIVTPDWEEIVG